MVNEELVKRYQDGDMFVLDELSANNINLIKYIAKRYKPRCSFIDMDDLIQEGWTGFFRAIQTYKADNLKAAKFSTWAVLWIRQAINRFLKQKVPKYETSLNEAVGEDGTTEKLDLLEDLNDESFLEMWHRLEVLDLRKELDALMDKNLRLKQREILKLHFGWDIELMNLKEIGEMYEVSPQAIYNAEAKAIRILRRTEWVHAKKQEMIFEKKTKYKYRDPVFSLMVDDWLR